jgi:hypothetical protein
MQKKNQTKTKPMKTKTETRQLTHADTLLTLIDELELLNLGGKAATRVISKLVKLLTEDVVWANKYMGQQDALDLVNSFEQLAHTGKPASFSEGTIK